MGFGAVRGGSPAVEEHPPRRTGGFRMEGERDVCAWASLIFPVSSYVCMQQTTAGAPTRAPLAWLTTCSVGPADTAVPPGGGIHAAA
jgi:hypothetical protein